MNPVRPGPQDGQDSGAPVWEVREDLYVQLSATHHLVESKDPILFLAFMLLTTAGGVIGWVGSELAGALALIAGMLGFIVGVLYFVARERGRRNRFGIFEKGIAPPWKPVSCRSKGRTVVPYSRILRLEYVAPDCLRVVVSNVGSFCGCLRMSISPSARSRTRAG